MIKISKNDTIDYNDKGIMKIEILDENIYEILSSLSKILPPMNVEEIIILNNLKYSPGIAKISKKYVPLNTTLWKQCFDSFNYKKNNFIKLAIRKYEINGGRWNAKDI